MNKATSAVSHEKAMRLVDSGEDVFIVFPRGNSSSAARFTDYGEADRFAQNFGGLVLDFETGERAEGIDEVGVLSWL